MTASAEHLGAASSVLTHENERRWRIFHELVEQITTPAHATRPPAR
jgi:hypothetical protein